MNRSEKSCCSCSVRIISVFGTHNVVVAAIAVAVPMRSDWPARHQGSRALNLQDILPPRIPNAGFGAAIQG